MTSHLSALCEVCAFSKRAVRSLVPQRVITITIAPPGCKRVRIAPQLGNLKWAEGKYPTPLGPIHVRHERKPDGTISSKIDAPRGIIVESQKKRN